MTYLGAAQPIYALHGLAGKNADDAMAHALNIGISKARIAPTESRNLSKPCGAG
ncbi:MAG: hypothetical protein EDM05_60720 [Leptolyngbya sp. IPPAS B-1204]|nr:hypothetical protein [Elainella sp. C42_A2020_010]